MKTGMAHYFPNVDRVAVRLTVTDAKVKLNPDPFLSPWSLTKPHLVSFPFLSFPFFPLISGFFASFPLLYRHFFSFFHFCFCFFRFLRFLSLNLVPARFVLQCFLSFRLLLFCFVFSSEPKDTRVSPVVEATPWEAAT